MGNKVGSEKIAAKRLGISYEEYLSKLNSNLKWCTSCKTWKSIECFNKDMHRGDGLSSKCKVCNYISKSSKPLKGSNVSERKQKLLEGYKWCRDCKDWIAIDQMTKNGICKVHAAKYSRDRYAKSENVRMERRQHAHARKRNVKPIPVWLQQELLQIFDGKCAYCQKSANTWDHVVAISKGGDSVKGNVVPCCHSCNSSKRDNDLQQWLSKNKHKLNPHSELKNIIMNIIK